MVLLRLFADCKHEAQATQITAAIILSLSAFTPVQTMPPLRYWKIPEYFEFSFALSPATRTTFLMLIATHHPDTWLHLGDENDGSAVWNRSPEHCFLLPEIAWAELIFSS